MVSHVASSTKALRTEFVDSEELISKINYSIYNLKLVKNSLTTEEFQKSFFHIAEKVVYTFILALVYLFLALEEIDHQVFSASENNLVSEEEFDEWSIWHLLDGSNNLQVT